MVDHAFFKKSKSFTIREIADLTGSDVPDGVKKDFVLNDLSALKTAKPDELSFLDNAKYKGDFLVTKAGACFVSPNMVEHTPKGTIPLITKTPYKAYALTAQKFYPVEKPSSQVAASAFVHDNAKIGQNSTIMHGVYIGEGVEIGDNVWIEPNAVIDDNTKIGNDCRIGNNVSITHAIIGNNVRLYPGVRIGQDGFGFAIDPMGHVKVPQLGRVIIHDSVEIGANTTIDRGAGPDTIIGLGTWIDNLVQIGHNVEIGRGCIIVSQVGISGSTKIGDFVALGGQVGIAGHLKIGTGAQVAAQSGVMRDIPAGETQAGSPAFPSKQHFRHIAALNRLINTKKSD